MNFHDLVSNLIDNTRDVSVPRFMAELTLCGTIVVMLLARMIRPLRAIGSWVIALIGSAVALYLTAQWSNGEISRVEIFTGMLVYDGFTVFIRSMLLIFVILFIIFTKLSGIPDREDGADIYTLVLGATVGMCLMASANHLLMVFLGVEMASVPSYALAATLKGRRVSSEAALKYAIYGAGAAGLMLYGISLLAGSVNSLHLPTIAVQLADQLPTMDNSQVMILALGGLLVGVGLAFKLSAVPFHFWCPDVFEGAPAEVNAFLSVASKAAALALLVRVAVGFGAAPHTSPRGEVALARTNSAMYAVADEEPSKASTKDSEVASDKIPAAKAESTAAKSSESSVSDRPMRSGADRAADRLAALAPARNFMGKLIALLAVVTCTFGNLAAYGQTNIKRLFAYSTIAHAGYMMMAVPALLALAGYNADSAERAAAGLGVYIFCYLFMNLGVFAVIAFLRNAMRSENIADYAGLVKRCPLLVICFSLMLFSLVGLPPLSGFIGKLAVFASLVEAYEVTSAHGAPANYLLVVLVIGSLNTAISLFYYLRVVKVMTIDAEAPDRRPLEFSNAFLQGLYVGVVTLPSAALILSWDWLYSWTLAAANQLLG